MGLKDLYNYKASRTDIDKDQVFPFILKQLEKFNFETDYLEAGSLEILTASEIVFHTCFLENFTDTRSIAESNKPNRSGVSLGSKRVSEFNVWDYKLKFAQEFRNSENDHEISESHHAIGCSVCKQHGKIRCSSCRGAGDVTCSTCSGRGENQCSSCSGRGESKCWSCSGKGTKESGYGDNKRIERCSSCSGRGYKPCTSCRSGYVTCSRCSGKGRVTCYTCNGSGEVTCYQCDGYRTMDHYFVVHAKFINLQQQLYVTNPFPGYDSAKVSKFNFDIQKKIFDFKESRFSDGYFDQLQAHPLLRQIITFFNFSDSSKTKLISSRFSVYENKYYEVEFSFHGEKYTIFLDQNYTNSYYDGKKPSDQYELDLLKMAINLSASNQLFEAKNIIEKLSKYDFIGISESQLIASIDDTLAIYDAKNEIDSKGYSRAEEVLKSVSSSKKNESDYATLIDRLDKVYRNNTLVFGLLGAIAITPFLLNKNSQIVVVISFIILAVFIFCLYLNKLKRNINFARWFIVGLFFIQLLGIKYIENKFGVYALSERSIESSFLEFKKSHVTVFDGNDSIILVEPTGLERKGYFLPKGKSYNVGFGDDQIAKKDLVLDIEESSFENNRYRYEQSNVVTKDVGFGGATYITVKTADIQSNFSFNDIELKVLKNNVLDYKLESFYTIWLRRSTWEEVRSGKKKTISRQGM